MQILEDDGELRVNNNGGVIKRERLESLKR